MSMSTSPIAAYKPGEIAQVSEPAPNVSIGFSSTAGFELMQRGAKLLASSSLVPKDYQGNLANCVIALNMASRLGADPLLVMQNLYPVHGRPTWSAKFLIATFNQCGRFTSIRYEWKGKEGEKDWGCRAWATEKLTGDRIEGAWITWKMVEAEGWNKRNGSKWLTIPDQMFMYRAAAWLVNTHAPELSMGLSTAEEIHDVFEAEPDGRGGFAVAGGVSGVMDRIRGTSGETSDGEIVDHSTGEVVTQPHGEASAGQQGMAWTYGDLQSALKTANTREELDEAASLISSVPNATHRELLNKQYDERVATFEQDEKL